MGDLGQNVPMRYNPRDESSIKVVMENSNVVINIIGREYLFDVWWLIVGGVISDVN